MKTKILFAINLLFISSIASAQCPVDGSFSSAFSANQATLTPVSNLAGSSHYWYAKDAATGNQIATSNQAIFTLPLAGQGFVDIQHDVFYSQNPLFPGDTTNSCWGTETVSYMYGASPCASFPNSTVNLYSTSLNYQFRDYTAVDFGSGFVNGFNINHTYPSEGIYSGALQQTFSAIDIATGLQSSCIVTRPFSLTIDTNPPACDPGFNVQVAGNTVTFTANNTAGNHYWYLNGQNEAYSHSTNSFSQTFNNLGWISVSHIIDINSNFQDSCVEFTNIYLGDSSNICNPSFLATLEPIVRYDSTFDSLITVQPDTLGWNMHIVPLGYTGSFNVAHTWVLNGGATYTSTGEIYIPIYSPNVYVVAHTVVVTDNNNNQVCTDSHSESIDASQLRFANASAIDEVNSVSEASIYPNPIVNQINIALNSKQNQNITLSISNVLSQTIYSRNYNLVNGSNNLKIDELELMPGMYFVQLRNGSQLLKSFKVIKE